MPSPVSSPVAQFVRFNTSDSSISVGDLVCISKAVNDNVVRCDASDNTKMPAIGIAKSVSSSSVVVQLNYVYTLPSNYVNSVVAGDTLYCDPSNPGKLTSTVPTTGFLQEIGSAKSSTKIILSIDNFFITL